MSDFVARATPAIRIVGGIGEKNLMISGQKTAGRQTVGYMLSGSSKEILRLLVPLAPLTMTCSPGQGRQPSIHDEREHQGTIDR